MKYLTEAREYLNSGEYEKASESLWGSLASALNALSITKHGKPLTSHQDFRLFAKQLSAELSDPEIYRAFREAEKLHANFYHAILTTEDLIDLFPKIEQAIRKILVLISGV